MKILEAHYDTKDVTEIVKSKIKNDILYLYVSNDIFGDPNYGKLKTLNVSIEENNNKKNLSCVENNFLLYPALNNERLGIFCSNNNKDKTKATIIKSLNTIRANKPCDVDIITCMWEEEPENPFIDINSKIKNIHGNLNHQLQILQCLNFAKHINPRYKYVSFLEHDVLYPINYFLYEEFTEDYIINDNYIGLNSNGFQLEQIDHHMPLSQITMNFEFALKYFNHNFGLALIFGFSSVEPHWTIKYESSHKIVKNQYPSVHINHGHSFTSHYTCFCKDTSDYENYWGHYSQYSNLF